MKKLHLILKPRFLKLGMGPILYNKANYIENLHFIYSAENCCLRKIPRLVILLGRTEFSKLLSDHISVIMDRLNRLDYIFYIQKSRAKGKICNTFKNFISKVNEFAHISEFNDIKLNLDIIDELMAISRYRNYIYNILAYTKNTPPQNNIKSLIIDSLKEEESFYQGLIKMQMDVNSIK